MTLENVNSASNNLSIAVLDILSVAYSMAVLDEHPDSYRFPSRLVDTGRSFCQSSLTAMLLSFVDNLQLAYDDLDNAICSYERALSDSHEEVDTAA